MNGLPTILVTYQLQVERRTGSVHRPETDVLLLCYRKAIKMLVWAYSTFIHTTAAEGYALPIVYHMCFVMCHCVWMQTWDVNIVADLAVKTLGFYVNWQNEQIMLPPMQIDGGNVFTSIHDFHNYLVLGLCG